ncbi:MAG: hypothetical protein KA792_02770 [Bacteroidales bacterium]|nr:hypothetical protein [Bacteroidales bacterium]
MLKKRVLSIVLIIITTFGIISAQNNSKEEKGSFKDRLIFGGNLGLQFGSNTFIDLSPFVGYKITEKLIGGVGISYRYMRYKDYDFSTDIYGGRLFGRYYLMDNLFAHVEYELLNLERIYFDYNYNVVKAGRVNVESYLAGGGYSQPLGSKSYFTIIILWNFNETALTPYTNPIIRAGIDIGF